eukprot:gene12148-12286_t
MQVSKASRSWIDKEGSLCLRVESGDDNKLGTSWDSLLLMACSTDPFHLVDAGVAAAAALSGGAGPRSMKRLPSSLDGFGWCTWDAFYSTVSARGLVEGLSSLAAGGVRPRLLIIDDGWQLTDVDPPYGKAPTAQLAEKLTGQGPASKIFEGPKEMVLTTQDTFYQENAKLLAEASEQMQQEGPTDSEADSAPLPSGFSRSLPRGAISHHHAPPASTWDAPADAVAAAKEAEIAASLNSQDGDAAAVAATAARGKRSGRGSRQGRTGPFTAAPVASRDDDDDELRPDWAQARPQGHNRARYNTAQQQPLADKHSASSSIEKLLHDTHLEEAAAAAEEKLKLAAAEAEEAMKRALKKAAPTPRQQFILIRWAQKAAGALVGLATAAFLLFYQWVVEPAPSTSLRVKAFAALAQGVLRGAMLMFFASASDFTRRLTSVEANAKFSRLDAGPEEDWEATSADLKAVVTNIKARFGVRHVYCWHGLPAYWGGIMPGSPSLAGVTGAQLVFPKPTRSIAEVEPSLLWSPAVLAGVGIADNPAGLYSAMHSYLADSAVDGVKVDCQAGVGLVGSCLGGGPAASRLFQAALEDSIAVHFPGNHAINCMCHSSENFYRFSRTAVARVSDDYYPRDPASSTPHIGACAFNSLYLGALVQPDWDMFQSAHPAGVLHGMARAVSGGAVYVSDKPGQHDFELLRRLVLPDGSVLRALLPGRPTRDCLFKDVLRDKKSLLKVWNVNPVVGVVGVFNLQGSSWDHPAGSDLVWISPLHCCNGASLAPLGLIEMFNGGGSVLSCSITPGNAQGGLGRAAAGAAGGATGDDGLRAIGTLQLRGNGRFLAYSSGRPARVLVNLTPRDFVWDQFTKRLEFEVPQLSEEELHCEVEVLYH